MLWILSYSLPYLVLVTDQHTLLVSASVTKCVCHWSHPLHGTGAVWIPCLCHSPATVSCSFPSKAGCVKFSHCVKHSAWLVAALAPVDCVVNILSALSSSHSAWHNHHAHTPFSNHPAPLNPVPVFQSDSFCAMSSYRSCFPPHMPLNTCPPPCSCDQPVTTVPFKNDPLRRNLIVPCCTFCSGICTELNIALEKLGGFL